MKTKISGHTLFPNGIISEAILVVEDGIIKEILPGIDTLADYHCEGIITPAFIDLQINGAVGIDFTDDSRQILDVAAFLPETGVSGFLPTLVTTDLDSYPKRISEIQQAIEKQEIDSKYRHTARILGIHLEGPYLNPSRPGAHPIPYLRNIDLLEIAYLADPRFVKIFTLAPELPGGIEAIQSLRKAGVVTSMGHTAADYDQAVEAITAGVGWTTHLFNAMNPLNHRQPGLVGAVLESNLPCGMIVDGIHIHPAVVKLVYRLKGSAGITLVTDAMAALGMPAGQYPLGDQTVIVEYGDQDIGTARLESGTLAGSLLRMDQAIRGMVRFTGCSMTEAVTMASLTPARLLGLDQKMGKIAIGYQADLVVLDEKLTPKFTFIKGEVAYSTPS